MFKLLFIYLFYTLTLNSITIKHTCKKNCINYFDGCNTCSCNPNNPLLTLCTLRYCQPSEISSFVCNKCAEGFKLVNNNCIKIKPKPEPLCPYNCISYFDGCNGCSCDINNPLNRICTKRACKPNEIKPFKCNACPQGFILRSNKCIETVNNGCPEYCKTYRSRCSETNCKTGATINYPCAPPPVGFIEPPMYCACKKGYIWDKEHKECKECGCFIKEEYSENKKNNMLLYHQRKKRCKAKNNEENCENSKFCEWIC